MDYLKGPPQRDARRDEVVALDIEMFQQTKPLHLPTGMFACLSIAMEDKTYQVYTLTDLKKAIARIQKGTWAFHNATYDLRQLRRFVDIPDRFVWDILLVEHHLYAGYYTQTFKLKDLARRYLGIRMDKEARDEFPTTSEMTPEMEEYAATDAEVTRKIALLQMEIERKGVVDFRSYRRVNEPALWAVLAMNPVRVDPDLWMKTASVLGEEGRRIQEVLGINVNATGQVKGFVESMIGQPIKDTSKDTLLYLAGDEDTADGYQKVLWDIMKARTLLKMQSTYGETFLATMGPGGYILPGWGVDVATTGRMACESPNFMNVPEREYPQFRTAVIASDGNQFIVSDASQQEPRVGAVITGDPELLRLVRLGVSIYISVAAEILEEKITKKDDRYNSVKAVTLGSFYGLGPKTLARREKISIGEATYLQERFFKKFVRVEPWMHKERQMAYSLNYVETLLGRRLWICPYDHQWENNAVNNPIQGTAAEITKLAMVYMYQGFKNLGLDSFPIVLQVHDELNADVPAGLVKPSIEMMDEAWKQAGKDIIPQVPFVTEFGHGANWGCKH